MEMPWWKTRTVYQIYPRSFLDTNGDGIGDINGITHGLDQIKELGAGIVWISPLFVSPMADNGYDMADYKAIDPIFGTMADFEAMIARAKELDLKIVLDIALNHTSTSHPWFQAAIADKDSPYRKFYHWRDQPNNWQSIFGGPAWSKPEGDDCYYLHLFDKTQADLNWSEPGVRVAIHDALRFWLQKGVDGFRLDVVTVISKPAGLPDAPDPRPVPLYDMLAAGPDLHTWLRDMNREVFAHFDCVAIGEGPGLTPERAKAITNPSDPMLNMIYHFDLVDGHDNRQKAAWDRVWFKSIFSKWDQVMGEVGWNTCVMGNHDLRRLVSRFGDDQKFRIESAKALAAVCLLQRATPFIYQGDELAMADTRFESMEELDDVWAKTTYRLALEKGYDTNIAFDKAATMTRDHARTPLNWTPSGGFSIAKPWLPQKDLGNGFDLDTQSVDPNSVRSFYRNLIGLRANASQTWVDGDYNDLAPDDPDVYVFQRGASGLVVINLTSFEVTISSEIAELVGCRTDQPVLVSGTLIDQKLSPWATLIFA